MKKYFAELVGTFFLVFFGVGTAVITGGVPGRLAYWASPSPLGWA